MGRRLVRAVDMTQAGRRHHAALRLGIRAAGKFAMDPARRPSTQEIRPPRQNRTGSERRPAIDCDYCRRRHYRGTQNIEFRMAVRSGLSLLARGMHQPVLSGRDSDPTVIWFNERLFGPDGGCECRASHLRPSGLSHSSQEVRSASQTRSSTLPPHSVQR
jgi:hypothetical protein